MAKRGRMGNRAAETSRNVDQLLQDRGLLLLMSTDRLAALHPQVSDPEAFDALVTAVQVSARQNEDVAQFRARIEALGGAVLNVAKEVISKL